MTNNGGRDNSYRPITAEATERVSILGSVGGQKAKDQAPKAPRFLGTEPMPPMPGLDEVARLDAQQRSQLATILRQVSETFAEVPDGKTASYVLGVFAFLLDPG